VLALRALSRAGGPVLGGSLPVLAFYSTL
jgi:hypothetical protein